MDQAYLALIILAIVVVLFVTEVIPLWTTAIAGMLAMCFTGIMTFSEAFTAGFASVACVMTIGTCTMGNAFFTTGCAGALAEKMKGLAHKGETFFTMVVSICSGALSIIVNGTVVTALFMPVIDAVSEASGGKIKRKNVTLPMAISSVFGSCTTAFSMSSIVTASGILAASAEVGRTLTPFEPFRLYAPIVLTYWLFLFLTRGKYATAAFKNTVENAPAGKEDGKVFPFRKTQAIIFGLSIIGMLVLLLKFKTNQGGLFLLLTVVLVLTKCIDANYMLKNNNWGLILMLAGAMAFGKGIENSGAAKLVADLAVGTAEKMGLSAFMVAVIILILITLMSNFMSNNSAIVIVMPIALAIATGMGADPMGFAMAVIIGANLSVATPVCTPAVSLTYSVGYRFMDYVKFGGLVNLAGIFLGSALMKIFYF
ncbi:MAG: TRAP transporter large permease subunit [Clostridiales bacterium]|nr:TRAP transporter large permease subunit [Clostridiales bacterium]